jgi:hypothetical protein
MNIVDHEIVQEVDSILDSNVSSDYKHQPLAQDWGRVAKIQEEAGEAISELILWTGQNPRKGTDREARQRLLEELADTAMTAIYAIQHFTKDIRVTSSVMEAAQEKHVSRLRKVV